MANMSYCRFQNTYNDFLDCYQALVGADNVEDLMNELSSSEKLYAEKLFRLCRDVVEIVEESNTSPNWSSSIDE